MNLYENALIVLLAVILTFISRFILFIILVPDQCAFHNGKERGFIMERFYDFTATNG